MSQEREHRTESRYGAPEGIPVNRYGEEIAPPVQRAVGKTPLTEGMVQRQAGAGASDVAVQGAAQHGISQGGGPLPHLDTIQASFGRHDVSHIEAHTGEAAAQGSRAMGATAYAIGSHTAFSEAPSLHTAAHEAAHVVQQRGGVHLEGGVGHAGDPYEQHADQVADRVVAGGSAEGLLDTMAGGATAPGPTSAGAVQRNGEKGVVTPAPTGPSGAPVVPDGAPPAHGAGPLATLMATLTVERAAALSAGSKAAETHDAELLQMLLSVFECNWFKAKDCLLFDKWPIPKTAPDHPPHAACLELMQALVNMRSRVCKKIADQTQKELPKRLGDAALSKQVEANTPAEHHAADTFSAEVGDKKLTPKDHLNLLAPVGNEKKTSDIDVASNGRNTEIGVALFNELFRATLKVPFDPATLFDYNVYAMDWIFPGNFVNENVVKAREVTPGTKTPLAGAPVEDVATKITPKPEHIISGSARKADDVAINANLQEERGEILDDAALLHIRRNCSQADWKVYVNGRLAKVTDREAKNSLRDKLQAVDLKYKEFAAQVADQALSVGARIGGALEVFDQLTAWKAGKNDEYQHEAVNARASNEIYQKRLMVVKGLRLHYNEIAGKAEKSEADIKILADLARDITQALADAIFFANEVYATEGATLHAVVAIQTADKRAKKYGLDKVDVVMTKDHYMQAFHENVGDSLHSIGHYQHDPPYAVYRAGKYIERMVMAADSLCGKGEASKHAKYAALFELGVKAAGVKASDSGDDPLEIAKAFSDCNAGTLTTLKQSVLVFGGDIPALSAEVAQAEAERTARAVRPAEPTPAEPAPKTPILETSNPLIGNLRTIVDSLRAAVEAQDPKKKP